MFSTPLIFSSRGAATVSATTAAEAPGKVVVTDTDGGVMSGMLSTGSSPMDSTPTRTMTIEITDAKMGR
jgi:hypothetical protein